MLARGACMLSLRNGKTRYMYMYVDAQVEKTAKMKGRVDMQTCHHLVVLADVQPSQFRRISTSILHTPIEVCFCTFLCRH